MLYVPEMHRQLQDTRAWEVFALVLAVWLLITGAVLIVGLTLSAGLEVWLSARELRVGDPMETGR